MGANRGYQVVKLDLGAISLKRSRKNAKKCKVSELGPRINHQVEQSLQVLPVGILNHDPTLPATGDHPNLGIEPIAEGPFDLQNPRIPRRYRIVDRLHHWVLNLTQTPYKILDLSHR